MILNLREPKAVHAYLGGVPVPVANTDYGSMRLQHDRAERRRHCGDAQGRHEQPAAVHHGSCALPACAALQVQGHLQEYMAALLQGTWEASWVRLWSA